MEFRRRFFDYTPNVTRDEARSLVLLPVEAHFERRGQWADIYVNPATPHLLRTPVERVRRE